MELSDEMLIEIAYVDISQYRKKIIKSLQIKVKMPKTVSNETGIRSNHVSRVLADLKEHELVECINPEAKKGRLYRLTEKGEVVANNLEF